MALFSSFVAFRKLRDGHDVEKNVMLSDLIIRWEIGFSGFVDEFNCKSWSFLCETNQPATISLKRCRMMFRKRFAY
jgi:hypothetical protein